MRNYRKSRGAWLLMAGAMLFAHEAKAQLSSNPDKFLGNITTSYQVDYGSEKYYTLWNQITPENESKWGSIEGNARGQFNWSGCDNAFNYAQQYGFPFKFHCLIWGAQYPNWMNNLSTADQYDAIVEWFDAVKEHYPDLPFIDVVNEAVAGHQPAPYKNALGGDGKTGYDWIIKAFEMAHERWPNAVLIYNDYNTFQWQRTEFINLVKTLRDAGAPIDAYGCQSHDLTDMNFTDFKKAMVEIQDALQIPMYSTEYDIGTTDDALQKQRYSEQIPYMWEADYVAGITLWGYIYGKTWTTDGNSGLIKNGKDRPAMTWLREYMASEAAQQAKSPYPGMYKEASIYIKPSTITATQGEEMSILVRAEMKSKSIEKVDLYLNGNLAQSFDEAPYLYTFTPEELGRYDLKAIVTTTDGETYSRVGGFTNYKPRTTYKENPTELPGTIEAEDFDMGPEGIAFHESDTQNEGVSYRTDEVGVDIVTGNGGYALGYTAVGEWLEYTVDVKEAGYYDFAATLSTGSAGAGLQLELNTENGLTNLSEVIYAEMVKSGSWDDYRDICGRTLIELPAGKQIIRITIMGANVNIDKIRFDHVEINPALDCTISADPAPATVGTPSTLKATVNGSENIASVKIFVNGLLQATLTEAPYEVSYSPKEKGSVIVSAEATDADGKVSNFAQSTLKVNNKRTPYRTVNIPGTFQAENFDKGGEGLTFHDSDSENSGDVTNYRSDAEGVDFVKGNNGTVIGYTNVGEWLEYAVNVKEAGVYSYIATVSSGATNSGFKIGLANEGTVTNLANVSVPQTGSNDWSKYVEVGGTFSQELEAGKQILRITITGANCNIDKIELVYGEVGIEEIQTPSIQEETLYNLAGQRVGTSYKGLMIQNGRKLIIK